MKNIELIDKIKDVFKNEEYPGDLELVYDNSGKHLECIEVRGLYKGKQWDKLSDDFLVKEYMSLNFFTNKSFKYYLPAFMILTLKDYEASDNVPNDLVYKLTLPTEGDAIKLEKAIKESKIDKKKIGVDFNAILKNNIDELDQSIHSFFEKVKLYNKGQCETILDYLKYITENHSNDYFNNEPEIAIERYWFIYEK